VVHQPPRGEKTITVTVFKVPGETNTDDLSPAPDAWSRPDIPLHYLAMLKNTPEARPSSPKKTASAARCSSSRT
jgi:aconitate hydratase 2/2-methylisocitrate dehydratase